MCIRDSHNNTKRLETFDNSPFVGVAVTNDLLLNSSADSAIRWAVGGTASSNFKWSLFYSNSDGSLNLYDNVNSRTITSFKTDGSLEARDITPQANNSYDLGTTSKRWRNIYTNDLNLSNEGGANDVDGTWGSYTIQEGAEDLFLVNKRNGKKYKFALTEVN